MKRGQVTLFIFIGILVLIAVSLTFYVNKEYVKSLFEERITRLKQIPQEIQPLDSHISSCLEETSKLSLNLIYMQGGYFEPKNSMPMEAFDVAYWYYKKDLTPSLTIIENEISKSMNYLLPGCILNFEEEYEIEIKELKPSIHIKKNKVIVSSDTSLMVNYKNLTHTIDKNYEISFNSEAKNMYNSAKIIINSEKSNPGIMDLTLLASLPYTVNFFKFNEKIVYALSSEELTLMIATQP